MHSGGAACGNPFIVSILRISRSHHFTRCPGNCFTSSQRFRPLYTMLMWELVFARRFPNRSSTYLTPNKADQQHIDPKISTAPRQTFVFSVIGIFVQLLGDNSEKFFLHGNTFHHQRKTKITSETNTIVSVKSALDEISMAKKQNQISIVQNSAVHKTNVKNNQTSSTFLSATYSYVASTDKFKRKVEQGILTSAVPTPKTPIYQRYTTALQNDPRCSQEVALGRRIGLYRFCGDIGRGNFSRVKLAVHQLTKDKVAIKVVDTSRLDAKALRMLSREVSTLECVYHPFILRLFEVIETLGKIHLISEWVQGGELYNRITEVGPLKEAHAALLFQQLLLAVKHLHSLGFVHRDIKAENVLLVNEERIKLADFGFSTQLVNGAWQHLDTFCGSPPYAAPELFSDDHYIGGPVDIWALGILLYFMLEGCMPFKAPTVPLLRTAVLKGEFVISTSLSIPCCRVIQRVLVHTPSRRPTIEQLLDCQWFKYAQHHAGSLERTNQHQTTVGQIRNPNNVTRHRRKRLFWFLPAPRDRLSSPDSNTASRDNNLSAANNNQRNHQHHHHPHRNQPVSSSTKSSSSRDERLINPPEIPNLRTIACSTKRAASVLDEGYLHPLKPDPTVRLMDGTSPTIVTEHHLHHSHYMKDQSNDVSNNNNINNNANGTNDNYNNQLAISTGNDQSPAGPNNSSRKESAASQERKPRRFSFGRTLKKRIGPMELVSAETLSGPNGSHASRVIDLREKLHRTIDEEHGRFVMYPTMAVSSEGNRHLHPLETETRRLMKALGITGEMIGRAVANGPRSDIVGVYRIIMHRLQREQTNVRLATTNGGAYEFLELTSINGTTPSCCSSGRSGPNGGIGRHTASSRRHIDQNRGKICAIL